MKSDDPFLSAMVAAVLSLVLVGLSIQLARKKGWFDNPDDPRKIHKGMVPRLGGPGIAIAFIISVVLFNRWFSVVIPFRYYVLAACAVALHIVGLLDDFKNLRARFKFLVQLIAAGATVAAGFSFSTLSLPFLSAPIKLGAAGMAITVVWIVGMANAVNMIDGMDGLAGGVGLIAAASFGAIHIMLGNSQSAVVALSLAGALVGFLFFNFPKASIFMGDSGSLFLGYVLSVLPLLDGSQRPWLLGVMPAGTVLAVPIFDVFAAMIRRRRRGDSIMTPDREHLHHKLLDQGLEVRQILAIIYTICIGLGAVVAMGVYMTPSCATIIQAVALVILAGGFIVLHYYKERRKAAGS